MVFCVVFFHAVNWIFLFMSTDTLSVSSVLWVQPVLPTLSCLPLCQQQVPHVHAGQWAGACGLWLAAGGAAQCPESRQERWESGAPRQASCSLPTPAKPFRAWVSRCDHRVPHCLPRLCKPWGFFLFSWANKQCMNAVLFERKLIRRAEKLI